MDEAFTCGTAAVQAAVQGQSGYMVKLVRESDEPYRWTTGLQPLDDIANVEHFIPRDWIAEDGWLPNEKFETYARPLIQGELHLPTKGGLPAFARLKKLPWRKNYRPARPESADFTPAFLRERRVFSFRPIVRALSSRMGEGQWQFEGGAFHESLPEGRSAGTLEVSPVSVKFVSEAGTVEMPVSGLQMEWAEPPIVCCS